jgi:hypothetical protein
VSDLAVDEQAELIGMGQRRTSPEVSSLVKAWAMPESPSWGELIEHRMGQQCPFSLVG